MHIKWIFGFCIGLSFLFPGASVAYAQPTPDLSPVFLPVPEVTEQTPIWCWLAVSEMGLRYRRGGSPKQCQMLEIGLRTLPGYCCSAPQRCLRAGSMEEIRRILGVLGGIHTQSAGPLQPMALYQVLRSGSPVIAAISTGSSIGHTIMIRGMRFESRTVWTPFGPRTEQVPIVLINDPMSYFAHEVPYATLQRQWLSSIVVGPAEG